MKPRFVFPLLAGVLSHAAIAAEPLDIQNRRELFVDEFLIEKLDGAERRLHRPHPREVAIVHDAPWEGNVSYYHTIFRDGDTYRMYYRGAHASLPVIRATHQVVCYAESKDGITWTKPNLGLHEFEGSTENNIIWTGIGAHNFAPFKDLNPQSAPEARYKAIGHGKGGLYVFQSSDAIHWKLLHAKPVITKGAFDSQNLAFYDSVRGRYVDFHRGFNKGLRAIMTCTSDDFIHWTAPEWITYNDDRAEHLYTNQTTPYPRAPHIFMAFPKRFLPSRNPTLHRNSGVSDIVFMSSRDGKTFDRWGEAFIRPGLQEDRWINRNNFVGWGIVETVSGRAGVPDELSFYSVEGYYKGESCQMRRYTLRPDGFVSVTAPLSGGQLLTKALTFAVPASKAPLEPRRQIKTGITHSSEKAIRGEGSLHFDGPSILHLAGTQDLGEQATLAVTVRGVPAGHRRLFSTYNGGGTSPDEVYFDISAARPISAKDGYAIRFNYSGVLTGAPFEKVGDWSAETDPTSVHHIAATWDDGLVKLYFDGRLVGSGGKPGKGSLKFKLGNLRFGEDYPPTHLSNEPFLGSLDDILVLRRELSADEIAKMAKGATAEILDLSNDAGVLLDFEDRQSPFADRLQGDGAQPAAGSLSNGIGEVELLLNFSASAAGSIKCEIQDESGKPIPGYSLAECDEILGDSLNQPVHWNGVSELKPLAGKPVRLRFLLKDADLYSLRFGH